MNSGTGTGGDPLAPRYVMPPIQQQAMHSERRRGGGRKNVTGGSYSYNGPRDNRMSSGYRDNRMSTRGSGGSGDGPHNGSGYRGGGNEYDAGQSGCLSQCGPGPAAPPSEGGHRSSHHHHAQGGHHYSNQQYSQQPHHYNHHHHNQHQSKNMDYDGTQVRTHSRGGGSNGAHHMDHRSGGVHQHHQDPHLHASHQPQTYGAGGGSGGHHHPEIVVVQPQQDHHYATGGNVPPVGGHFQAGTAPQQIPGPAVGFIGYPNGQPVMGSLVLCHIPYGMNPASVIAPGVQTQIIGWGSMNPTLQYNYACAVPSPLMPTQSVIFQTQSPQQHFIHPQPHFQPIPQPQPPPTSGSEESGLIYADNSANLNPDANAFYPSITSFSEEQEDEVEVGVVGDGPTPEITEGLVGSPPCEVKTVKEENVNVSDSALKEEVEILNDDGNLIDGSPITIEN